LHQRFGTMEQGMVRFSFSYFNTEEEIEVGIQALSAIAQEAEA
jgi:selenocysteine lyase/cysteine desulfurase